MSPDVAHNYHCMVILNSLAAI